MQPEETPSPKANKRFYTIIALLLVIAVLSVALVWCIFFYHPSSPTAEPGSDTPAPAATATGPCTDGSENTAPDGYVFYEDTTLGFKFAYPEGWGTVSTSTAPQGGTGDYLMGTFSTNENVWFGGNATDFVVGGRDGMPTDLPGYLEASSNFYSVEIWRYTDGATTEDRHDLHPIAEPYEEHDGCNTKVLMTHWEASELSSVGPADIARFNLQPDNHYYGVNFVNNQPTDASRAEVQNLISTFQLIP